MIEPTTSWLSTSKVYRRHVLALLLLKGVLGCKETGSQQNQSAVETAKAQSGQYLSSTDTVNRVVLLRSVGYLDLALLLGSELETKLVGWDASLLTGDQHEYKSLVSQFPQLKDVQVLGDSLRGQLSAESVFALNPDLVVASNHLLTTGDSLAEKLRISGVPTIFLESADPLTDPQRNLIELGKRLGSTDRAEAIVNWIDLQIDPVLDRIRQLSDSGPSVYMEAGLFGPDRYGTTFGKDQRGALANWGSLLYQSRCRNIAFESVRGPFGIGSINPEYLIDSDPDMIVVSGAGWTNSSDSFQLGHGVKKSSAVEHLALFKKRAGWHVLKAVRNDRVYGIYSRFAGGVTSFFALQQLAKWFHPNEFQDLNPLGRLEEFFSSFLPDFRFEGTWVVEPKG